MNKFYFIIISFVVSIITADTGSIVGEVVDSDTHQPLLGANIIINLTEFGTASNEEGIFYIKDIPVGSYTVSISMIGYASISRANVNIYSDRQTPIKFYLEVSALKGDKITVRSNYFEKAKDGIVSTQTFDREEIRSDPVGTYDIQMMMHSLPSVITSTDQNNEIIVRGGDAGENLFIVDNIEIPNPNHFGEVGTGGGPVNILNTEFVERVDFYAGGFPARYGDKQSSVMDIALREGNYNNREVNLEMNMAGLGLFVEGPYMNGKGSYMASFRQSFLKHLIKSAGLVAIPEYWNTQLKFTYKINNRKKIIINIIGAADEVNVEDENRPDLKGFENVKYDGHQLTTGITYKALLSSKGYTLLSLGKSSTNWNTKVYSVKNDNKEIFFKRLNTEEEAFLKWDIVNKLTNNFELSGGLNIKHGQYSSDEMLNDQEIYFYIYPYQVTTLEDYYSMIENNIDYLDNTIESPNPITIIDGFDRFIKDGLWKYSGYGQLKYSISRYIFNFGIRYDKVKYNSTSKFSPRFGFKIILSPLTKINFALGKFFQTPKYWILMNPGNPYPLKNSYTDQAVLGLEHLFSDDMRGTIELYSKKYFNRPIQISDITEDSLDAFLGFLDIGAGRAKGVELFLQKKFSYKWYGTLSYSYSRSEAKDYRNGLEDYYPWDYDFIHGFTLVGGYKFNFKDTQWYMRLRNSFFFPYISWIPFMVSDQMELSFRYKYSGARPYTPRTYNYNVRRWYISHNTDLNTERYSDYSRLDIMLLRKFNFKKINVITFIDIQNIFNKSNDWERVYFDDGTYEMSYQYKQLPVGGLIIEF